MPKAIVVGSINMDVVAFVDRHPSVGETVFGREVRYFPGGKGANQAVACRRFGAETVFVGRVGADQFGTTMVDFLRGEGIDTTAIEVVDDCATGTAFIVVNAHSENSIIVIPGANHRWDDAGRVLPHVGAGDVVLAQFEIPDPVVLRAFGEARAAGARTILNPAPARKCSAELLALTGTLVVNEIELAQLAEKSVDAATDEALFDAAATLTKRGVETVVITLGRRGVRVLDRSETGGIDAHAVGAVDTTGAGDCFIGGYAAGILAGRTTLASLALGNAAAAISVTRKGAGSSMPSLAEVMALYGDDIRRAGA